MATAVVAPPATPSAAVAGAITLRDDRGVEHRFARPAARLVSLLPSLTEIVGALGATGTLVGVDRHSDWPAAVAALPRLGGIDDAPVEAIVALAPDAVLASTSSARALDRLEALGVRVVRLKSDSHADVARSVRLVAALLGRPADGEALWARTEAAIDAAARRVPRALRGERVYVEIGGGPYAAGQASFIGQTLARLGVDNAVPAALGPFPRLNPEFVLRARPDIVIAAQADVAAMRQRPLWASTLPALRHGRVCAFAPEPYEMLVRPGPRLGEAAALLADCLQRLPAVP